MSSELFSKSELKRTAAVSYTEVDVAGVGKVRIKSLNALEAGKLEALVCNPETGKLDLARLSTVPATQVAMQVVDASGLPVFSGADEVGQLRAPIVKALHEACDAHANIVSMGEVEKNLPETDSARPTSVSRTTTAEVMSIDSRASTHQENGRS